MIAGIPDASVKILVSAAGIAKTNRDLMAVQGNLGATGAAAGKSGAIMKKGLMVGAAAAGALGVGLFKLGKSFDEAYDVIRTGTGATGENLERLKGDFKDVVKSVPTDFKSAGTAIADVNTRLDLTGQPLRDRAKQFLELSRITGTDLKGNIEAVSAAFQDWEIPVKRQGQTLDGFFRLSQKTGIGVDELAQSVQQFGSPLRQLGFTLEESAATFAGFQKAGVNTQTMVPGLKMAISNLTRPTAGLGKTMKELGIATGDPEKALKQVMKVMNDGSIPAAERTGLAMDVFGKKAGADMAEAIRQGRFEVSDLMNVMRNGGDTIMKAGKDTQSFSEKWQLFKNRVLVGLEPLAMAVFDGLGVAMEVLPPIAERVVAAVRLLIDPLVSVAKAVTDSKAAMIALSPIAAIIIAHFVRLAAVAAFGAVLQGLALAFWALNAAMAANPIVLIVIGISLLVAALITAYNESETFRNIVDTAFKGVKDAFGWLLNAAKDVFGWLKKNWPTIQAVIIGPIVTAVVAIVDGWDKVKDATSAVWNFVKRVVGGAAGWVWDKMKWVADKLKGVWEGIKTAASSVWARVKKAIIDPIRSAAGWVWDKIKWLGGALERGFKRIWDVAKNFAGGLKDRLVSGFKTGINFIINQLNRLIRAFNKLPGPNLGLIGAMAQGGKVAQYAQGGITAGGVVRAPLLMMGEDAPRHPEWVIPTNPAYRARALGLLGAAARDIGVSGFAHGGRTAPGGGRATHVDQSREVHLHEHGDRNYFYEADEDRATRKQLWQLRVAGLA